MIILFENCFLKKLAKKQEAMFLNEKNPIFAFQLQLHLSQLNLYRRPNFSVNIRDDLTMSMILFFN